MTKEMDQATVRADRRTILAGNIEAAAEALSRATFGVKSCSKKELDVRLDLIGCALANGEYRIQIEALRKIHQENLLCETLPLLEVFVDNKKLALHPTVCKQLIGVVTTFNPDQLMEFTEADFAKLRRLQHELTHNEHTAATQENFGWKKFLEI